MSVTTSAQDHWRRVPEERRRATLNLLVAVLAVIVACAGAAFLMASGLEGALAPASDGAWDPNAPALPAEVPQE